jgi:6-phosphogluconate dehydrogenase
MSSETGASGFSLNCDSIKSLGVLELDGQMADTDSGKCDVGVAGLGGMGRSIAQNISSHLFKVAACDSHPRRGGVLPQGLAEDQLLHAQTLPELAGLVRQPRKIFIFGETEASTDAIIEELLPHLAPRDLLIDAGDSYFRDAERRARKLSERHIEFMVLGIAGGDAAARQGAMIMAGGRREDYARTRPLLEALAAKVKGEPSAGYVGSAAAACFARMVHAGIEYGLMQLVSETFDLMQRTLVLSDEQLRDVSGAWHIGVLNGYLAEVSGHLFDPEDEGTERRQIEEKLNALKNNPAALWITQSARELGVPTPTIDAALGAQGFSARERQRSLILTPFRHPFGRFGNDAGSVLEELRGALYAAMIITYAEGLALLAAGSAQHGFHFDPVEVARIWKGGCSMRTTLLDDIAAALRATPTLLNLLCDEDLAEKVMAHQEFLRHAVWRASELDTVVPGLLASLDYLDSFRDAWLPVNLVQVQRDQKQRGGNHEWETEETLTMGL